ncbi:diguanylate cyclase [Lysobacter niabensis]|uniref:GGDEF domain-containing protein n=1 Tax=Agrilutibacter niabensis TaxID=380628 RepID=UPI00361334A4
MASALAQLDDLQAKATPTQQRQLRLLHAYQQIVTGKYDAAVKEALTVHDEATEVSIKFRAALLVANGAAITRDFSLGLRYLERALELANQVPDREQRHQAYLVASVLYNQYGQFSLAQHYADRLFAQETSPRNRCFAKQLRAEALYGLGTPMGEAEIDSAINDCSTQKEAIAANLLRGYLARQWAAQDKKARAIELLEAHLSEVEATGYPRLIGEINGLLAEYRLSTGDLAGAEDHAHRALAKGGKDAYSLPLVTAHKVLYEAALRRGNLKTALDEYRQYAEADKARLDEVKAREFAFQLSRHELQQKNQAIELLSRQNDVLTLQQEIAKKSALNNRLITLMLLLVLSVGAYWAYKIKRVQMMFRRQAQVDSLTGISNRGHFREQAEAQLARCATSGREAALVLLDLDNFKRINDRYGHATGDWVLKQVAAACQASCREGDLFGRLGGEEFAILTCGGDLHAAERIAQQCRENLAAIDTSSIDYAPAITASFGCATTRLTGHAFENLFMHADRAMYRAKSEGRDRVCTHDDNRPIPLRPHVIA